MPQIIKNIFSTINVDHINYVTIPKKRLEYLEFIENNYSTIINLAVLVSVLKEDKNQFP